MDTPTDAAGPAVALPSAVAARAGDTATDDRFELLLRLGDSALVLGQRLTAWVGRAPALEEDMALANTGLDLIGQARLWLSLAGEHEARGRDEDALAFLRDAPAFRNLLLVEQPNGSYADTLMRQYLFDSLHLPLLQGLAASTDAAVAAVAAKAQKEVAYHLRRSADLVVRLGDGSTESHQRMQRALDGLWRFSGEGLIADAVDDRLAQRGVAPSPATLRGPWWAQVSATLQAATLRLPDPDAWMQQGGRQGRHTEHLGYLLAEMQFLQRAYPGQSW